MPYLRLLGAQLAIGAAAIFARFALTGAGPLAVSALRLALAALVLVALTLVTRSAGRVTLQREAALALAGLALAVHFVTWIGSLLYTSVAISTLLVATTPIWTEVYDCVAERRRPSREYVLALFLALVGIALIASQRAAPAPLAGRALLGDGLALLGAIAIGAYLLVVRAAGFQPADGPPLATQQIVVRTYGWAALALVGLAFALHESPPALGDVRAWIGIGGMAIFSQLVGHTALNAALRDFTPSVIAMSTLLEPLFAALLAAAIFREALAPQAALGGALVLGAVALSLSISRSSAPTALIEG